jgi:hypothetical protein
MLASFIRARRPVVVALVVAAALVAAQAAAPAFAAPSTIDFNAADQQGKPSVRRVPGSAK